MLFDLFRAAQDVGDLFREQLFQLRLQIPGSCELPMLDIAFGLGNVDDKRLQFFQVFVGVCQIETESIPSLCMLVFKVLFEAGFQISGETNIVEAVSLIERIHTVSFANQLCYHILKLLKDPGVDSFEVS